MIPATRMHFHCFFHCFLHSFLFFFLYVLFILFNHYLHFLVFQGILLAYQFHPQLLRVYENVVAPKYGEIACKFAPKILKTLNTKQIESQKKKKNHFIYPILHLFFATCLLNCKYHLFILIRCSYHSLMWTRFPVIPHHSAHHIQLQHVESINFYNL